MAKAKAKSRSTAPKPKPRNPTPAAPAAPIATRAADSPTAKEFRALAGRFDAIDASDSHDGETAVRELSIVAAMTFKRAIDSGIIAGFQDGYCWPATTQPIMHDRELVDFAWWAAWNGVASNIARAYPAKIPANPLAVRMQQTAPGVMLGMTTHDDWRQRAMRFATVCGVIADEISGRAADSPAASDSATAKRAALAAMTPNEMAVLRCLSAKYPATQTQFDIANNAAPPLSERTVHKCLKRLCEIGLACYPLGTRGGATATEAGLKACG